MKLRIFILFSLLLHFSALWLLRSRQAVIQDLTEVQVIESFQFPIANAKSSPKAARPPSGSSPSSARSEQKHKTKTVAESASTNADVEKTRARESSNGEISGQNNIGAVHEGVVSEAPKVIQEKKISYPLSARRAGVEGVVELKLVIDANGRVQEAELVRGPGYGLDEAALGAIKEFRFSPAKIGEEKVAVRILYKYRFRLGGNG